MSLLAPGGPGWLLAICTSRVGAYMVYIAYAATLPVLQHLDGLDWYGIRTAGAWGWAFLSLGIAGVGAVVSVVLLHRTPAAAVLHRGVMRRAKVAAASAR